MKKIIILILLIVLITLLLPFTIVSISERTKAEPRLKIAEKQKEKAEDKMVLVYIKDENRVEEMEMSQYLKEVISAEMPADFHIEALKAQAVAARTYLINRMNAYKTTEKPEYQGRFINEVAEKMHQVPKPSGNW